MINLLENIIFFKFTIPFSMLHFFVFQTLSVTNLTLSSNDMTYGICTWMQAIVSNHLKQKRKFMLKIHARLHCTELNGKILSYFFLGPKPLERTPPFQLHRKYLFPPLREHSSHSLICLSIGSPNSL